MYANAVIKLLGWHPNAMVCYHCTKGHKPHPEPILKAIQMLKVTPNTCYCIGDDWKDIEAAKRAGAISVAALWGADSQAELQKYCPTYTCENVNSLLKLLEDNRLIS